MKILLLLQGLVGLALTLSCCLVRADIQQDLALLRARAGVQEVRIPLEGQAPRGTFYIQGEIKSAVATAPLVAKGVAVGAARDSHNAEAIARGFLLEFKNIWGIERGEELVLLSAQADSHGHSHLRFGRRVAAWRLEAMELIIHINSAGDITAVNGNLVPASAELTQFLRAPVDLMADDAIDLQLQRLFLHAPIKILKREILARNQAPFLIWRADLLDPGKGERFDIVINAITGELVSKTLRLHVREFNHGGR